MADAPATSARLVEAGVRLTTLGPTALRAVTHLDVTPDECAEAGRIVGAALRD